VRSVASNQSSAAAPKARAASASTRESFHDGCAARTSATERFVYAGALSARRKSSEGRLRVVVVLALPSAPPPCDSVVG
jgi:hypothetical protein